MSGAEITSPNSRLSFTYQAPKTHANNRNDVQTLSSSHPVAKANNAERSGDASSSAIFPIGVYNPGDFNQSHVAKLNTNFHRDAGLGLFDNLNIS